MWKAFLRYKVHELSNTQIANRCTSFRPLVKHVPPTHPENPSAVVKSQPTSTFASNTKQRQSRIPSA